ncbi:MAG: hypothetical protein VW362_01450 [Candidatus Nanopelagicales bacterium]
MTEADLRDVTGLAVSARLARIALAVSALIFVALGLLFLLDPVRAAAWLELDHLDPTEWALRVAGAVIIGLAGQTWLVRRAGDHPVMGASAMTLITSGLLGVLLITMPGGWGWLRIAMLGFCAVSTAAYVLILTSGRRA